MVLRTAASISIALVAMLAAPACASGGATDASSSLAGSGASVSIASFAFTPHALDVAAGTEVTWTNEDEITHTVTSGIAVDQGVPGVSQGTAAQPDGMFDQTLDGSGSTASFTFEETGTYTYYCDIHAGMSGTIHVT